MKSSKKRKIRINYKKMFLSLSILIVVICVFININKGNSKFIANINNIFNSTSDLPEYDIIKQDINNNYVGIGQEKVNNKDGYFTTFTTQNSKTYKEYKQNGNSSWCNNKYWDNTMETDGCGITAISIILSGYGKNFTPENLRKKYYPVLHGDKISNELYNSFGIYNSDFLYDSDSLSNEYIKNHLAKNKPILICVWNKPNSNRWTTASHYMVLLATDENNMVYVSNPNGLENNYKSSGWYNINEVTPYIAKALFILQ